MNQNGKAVITLISLLLIALGLTPYFSSSFENVSNGSFEAGYTGWTYWGSGSLTTTIISTDAHSGGYCAKVGQLKQTFSIPIPTSDVVSAGFWYKAPNGGLTWFIFYTDQIAQLDLPSSASWQYVNWMPFLTAAGTGNYFGAGGAGRQIQSIQFLNSNPYTYTVLVDDVSIITVSPPTAAPLTVTISPTTTAIYVGDSVTFTSSVSGGTSPYSYQWYLNDAKVSGATGSTWTFTPTSAGFPYVYLIVTDAGGQTAKSNVASVTVNAPVTPTPEYTIQFVVKDQCKNPLTAKVTFDGTSVSADTSGVTPSTKVSKTTLTVTAEIKVGTQTYSATETFSITASMTKEIVINRRFFWTFFINYTDGTLATGKIVASSSKETLTIPITNGYGEAYLIDATYTFSFEASPAVTLKTMTVTNDGNLAATINKENQTVKEISSNQTSIVTMPEIPWILIPSVYIYSLLGVLVLGFIIAAVVRLRRPPK